MYIFLETEVYQRGHDLWVESSRFRLSGVLPGLPGKTVSEHETGCYRQGRVSVSEMSEYVDLLCFGMSSTDSSSGCLSPARRTIL